jgi:vanillate O-demethylase ferredoxin subunit
MHGMMRATMRPLLLRLHRWTGLAAGLAFLLVAVTGAAMAFRLPLEPIVEPALLTAAPCASALPLDVLVERARAASPHAGPLRFIRLYDTPGATARIRFADGQWVYVDTCSGRVAGRQALYGGVFGTLGWLHIFGFMPVQEQVAGAIALVFALAMLAGGLFLWWPATLRAMRAALRLRSGLRGRALSLGLHKTLAFYAAPVLLASAVTGLFQAYHWGQSPPPAGAAPLSVRPEGTVSLQQMLEAAQREVPHPQKAQIRFPADPGMPVTFEMVAGSAPHANALSYVRIVPGTTRISGFVPYAANDPWHKAYLFAAALHYGWVGGFAGQLVLLLGALAVPVLAWTGTASWLRGRRRTAPKRLQVMVLSKTDEAQDICSFVLAAPDGGRLPAFAPGAHVEVVLPNGLVRHYSLCGDPRERRRYQIAVLKTPGSRGGSRAMHELLQAGDRLEIGTPRNHFALVPGAARTLLFAGGIGITPVIAMAEALHRAGADFELHYCCRSPQQAAFAERLMRSAYAHRVHFHYSEAGPAHRIDLPALLAAPDAGTHLYVCGPDGFMDAVTACALAQGWRGDQVHREHFAAPASDRPDDQPFDIRIASTGAIVHVARDTSALHALAAHGIRVQSSCEQGVCGTCLTGVLDGEPDHRDLFLGPAQRARKDCMALCCSRAHSPVVTLDL